MEGQKMWEVKTPQEAQKELETPKTHDEQDEEGEYLEEQEQDDRK